MPVPEPASVVSDDAALLGASKHTQWLGLLYLGGVVALTLGLAKFVLMPVLAPTVPVADNDPDPKECPSSPERKTGPDDTPRRLLKRPRDATPSRSHGSGAVTRADEYAPRAASLPRRLQPRDARGRDRCPRHQPSHLPRPPARPTSQ